MPLYKNFARFYEWFLVSRGDKAAAARWGQLKAHIALSAKLLRLGKPVEHLQYALRASLAPGSAIEKITATARQIAYVLFLSLDNILWAKALNLISVRQETYVKLGKLALRSWLAAIIFSIVNSIFKTARLSRETRLLKAGKHDEKNLNLEADRKTKLRALALMRADVRYQLTIDMLDLWNPATTLGFTNLNDGAIGIFGSVSSFLLGHDEYSILVGRFQLLWASENSGVCLGRIKAAGYGFRFLYGIKINIWSLSCLLRGPLKLPICEDLNIFLEFGLSPAAIGAAFNTCESTFSTSSTTMANVASQIVLHPAVSQSLKVGATTLGRDKAYRAAQNFARFYAWLLISQGHKANAARWTALKSHLGTARKLLRLGKPMEHLQAALRATLASGTPALEQIITIARQLAYFGYLSLDMLSWAHSIKFANFHPDTAAKIARVANRSWLAGILLNIIHAAVKTARLRREAKLLHAEKHQEKDLSLEAERAAKLRVIATTRAAVRHQFVIDLLDLWNPATSLGLSNLNDGVVGIFGVISSLMALEKHWHAVGGKN
ncbi:Peroxisomal biogenesis factor [Mycena sanguinolenta]|uniref:Peroxisomal biogenesis factor n=1 Tax=Mycena sanguinolenta TaxID=230812 RepID=A0A8H6XE13_9AGAR|nr:Peroxisomal biogenesis factor [Mycena sanguinolenta]